MPSKFVSPPTGPTKKSICAETLGIGNRDLTGDKGQAERRQAYFFLEEYTPKTSVNWFFGDLLDEE